MKIAVIGKPFAPYIFNIFQRHAALNHEVCCFIEMQSKTENDCNGIPVVTLSELEHIVFDAVLMAVSHNHSLSGWLSALYKKKVQNIYIIRLFTLNKRLDFFTETDFDLKRVDYLKLQEDKPYLVHLETHICDHCNLNCKACNNFSPFCKESSCASVTAFEDDMKKMTSLFSNIGRLFLLGGEPLLEPELCCKFIKIAQQYFPFAEIRLLTNGLLIPQMSQEFWRTIKTYNVIIHISAYPPTQKILPQIVSTLEQTEVNWILFKEVTTFVKHWTDSPLENAERNNKLCGSAGCHYLRDGRMYKCPDANLIQYIEQSCGTHLQRDAGLPLDHTEDGWTIIETLNRPCELCSYCTLDRKENITWEPAGSSPQASDWLVKNRLDYERELWKNDREKRENERLELLERHNSLQKQYNSLQKQYKIAIQDQKKLHEELENYVKKAQKSDDALSECKQELAQCHAVKLELEKRAYRLQKELNLMHLKLLEIEGHYVNMQKSWSFRVGRLLTWLPRKIRDIFCPKG